MFLFCVPNSVGSFIDHLANLENVVANLGNLVIRTEQNRTEQNRTEQTEQNRTEQISKFPKGFSRKFSKFAKVINQNFDQTIETI